MKLNYSWRVTLIAWLVNTALFIGMAFSMESGNLVWDMETFIEISTNFAFYAALFLVFLLVPGFLAARSYKKMAAKECTG